MHIPTSPLLTSLALSVHFLPRDAMLVQYMLWPGVCQVVCYPANNSAW